jgi:hypothetical protein
MKEIDQAEQAGHDLSQVGNIRTVLKQPLAKVISLIL